MDDFVKFVFFWRYASTQTDRHSDCNNAHPYLWQSNERGRKTGREQANLGRLERYVIIMYSFVVVVVYCRYLTHTWRTSS